MRFKRADLPGIIIATAAPAGLFLLVLAGYGLWDHHGTPLLPTIAAHIAIGAGLIGAFSRFVHHWGVLGTLIGALLATIAIAIVVDRTGNNSDPLRLLAAGLFVAINIVILREFVWNGIGPLLQRRDERRDTAD